MCRCVLKVLSRPSVLCMYADGDAYLRIHHACVCMQLTHGVAVCARHFVPRVLSCVMRHGSSCLEYSHVS